MARFVAAFAIDPGQAAASRARIAAFVARSPEFHLAFAEGAATIAVEASAQTWQDRGTVVTGALFERAPLRPATALSPGAFAAIGGSRGAHLVRHHWGGYVALLADPKGTTLDVIRGPLGELPCYIADERGTVVAASDMAALRGCGHALAIDPAALARHLLVGDLRRGETCLAGVRELAGGDRLALAATGAAIEPLWSPWSFTAPDGRTAEERDAALRDTARACVAARAAPFRHVVLKLSGGLDSSIVAACLAAAGRGFSCVTLATANPTGDERVYARLVAGALGVPLAEAYREAGRIALDRSAAARLPRPTARSFAQESTRIAALELARSGGDALFDGGGGDNVFCSLQSAAAVADCLLGHGWRHAWPTARSIARLADTGLPTVMHRALARALGRQRDYRWQLDDRLLSPGAREAMAGAVLHPWLQAPPGTLPGKCAHVALLAAAQSYVEGLDPEDDVPTVAPLLAQPLVEYCLGVPSWCWFEDGRNRAVARRAFAADLPPAIVARRSKGTPDSFLAEIYEGHRPVLAALLLDGVLAGHGLLDQDALRRALGDPTPVRDGLHARILQLADAEAWARAQEG